MPLDKLAELEKSRVKQRAEERKEQNMLNIFEPSGAASGADWSTCEATLLLDVVVAITAVGGAVTIGMSRDQGAHSLALLLDGERKTLWFDGNADLDAKLVEVREKLRAMT